MLCALTEVLNHPAECTRFRKAQSLNGVSVLNSHLVMQDLVVTRVVRHCVTLDSNGDHQPKHLRHC